MQFLKHTFETSYHLKAEQEQEKFLVRTFSDSKHHDLKFVHRQPSLVQKVDAIVVELPLATVQFSMLALLETQRSSFERERSKDRPLKKRE